MKVRKVTLKPGEQIEVMAGKTRLVVVGFSPDRPTQEVAVGIDGGSSFSMYYGIGALNVLERQRQQEEE